MSSDVDLALQQYHLSSELLRVRYFKTLSMIIPYSLIYNEQTPVCEHSQHALQCGGCTRGGLGGNSSGNACTTLLFISVNIVSDRFRQVRIRTTSFKSLRTTKHLGLYLCCTGLFMLSQNMLLTSRVGVKDNAQIKWLC